jgi:peptide/nickel transport system ATP-binding protein
MRLQNRLAWIAPSRRFTKMDEILLRISDLDIGLLAQDGSQLSLLRNINLAVKRREVVGIVGESGSGKSTLALAVMGHFKHGLHHFGGEIHFCEWNVLQSSHKDIQAIRGGRMALVPQNAAQSLTPNLTIRDQITETLRLHTTLPERDYRQRIIELIKKVRLPDPDRIMDRYPHELSGGQQQRIAIAMALAGEPELLLLDEPTTGLDVTTQAHILELLDELAETMDMAMIYVSHDLGAIARVCKRIVVMYAGEIVADGTAEQILNAPRHPYAKNLLASIPRVYEAHLPAALEGRPPLLEKVRHSCAFSTRCALKSARCVSSNPELTLQPDGSFVRCFHSTLVETWKPEIVSRMSSKAFSAKSILTIKDLAISYHKTSFFDFLYDPSKRKRATVAQINIELLCGETLALVGESGSGKSSILKAVAGLVPRAHGSMNLMGGAALPSLVEDRNKDELQQIQLIFQNPDESLNPRQTIAEILAHPLRLYTDLDAVSIFGRSVAMLDRVRLGAHYMNRLPAQLSGGEKQRVAIARAFITDAQIILCDEVTSALDVSVQAAVLKLLDDLKSEKETTYLFVAHDLAVVRAVADRVAVLYQGRLCEIGPVDDVYQAPHHPYTEALLSAVLEPVPGQKPKLLAQDSLEQSPSETGCPFQKRCHRSLGKICETVTPPMQRLDAHRALFCHVDAAELSIIQTRAGL